MRRIVKIDDALFLVDPRKTAIFSDPIFLHAETYQEKSIRCCIYLELKFMNCNNFTAIKYPTMCLCVFNEWVERYVAILPITNCSRIHYALLSLKISSKIWLLSCLLAWTLVHKLQINICLPTMFNSFEVSYLVFYFNKGEIGENTNCNINEICVTMEHSA